MTIPAGSLSGSSTFDLTPDENTSDNAIEILTLSGSAMPSGASVSTATIVLTDDDGPEVEVAAGTSPVTEGGSVTFTVTATPAPANALPVNVTVSGGESFLTGAIPASVTIEAGQTTGSVTLETEPDVVDEPGGVVTLTATYGNGYHVGASASAQVAVTDDDDPPTGIALSISPSTVSEGDSAAVVTMTTTPTGGTLFGAEQRVTVSVAGSGEANVVGFAAVAAFDVIIPAGAAEGDSTFTLVPVDNASIDADETITVSGTVSPSGVPVSSAELTLADDDTPVITVSAATDSVTEGTDARFTVTASPAPSVELSVNLSLSGAGDFLSTTAADTVVTIESGMTSAALDLGTVNDEVDEAHAAVTVTVTAGTGYDVGEASAAQVVVRDDDMPTGPPAAPGDFAVMAGDSSFRSAGPRRRGRPGTSCNIE